MNDKKEVSKRRRILIGIAAGGVSGAASVPERWSRPMVNAVTLPAHATTTDAGETPGGGTTLPPPETTPTVTTTPCDDYSFRGNIEISPNFGASQLKPDDDHIFARIGSIVVSGASAGDLSGGDLCIQTRACATEFRAALLYQNDGLHYHVATGIVGGPAVAFPQVSGGGFCIDNLMIKVDPVSDAGAPYDITGNMAAAGTLPIGAGCPADPLQIPPCNE